MKKKNNKISVVVAVVVLIVGGLAIYKFAFSNKAKFSTTAVNSSSTQSVATKSLTPASKGQVAGEQSYVVQPGDTLFAISVKYNVKLDVLAAYNNIAEPYNLQAGQTIKIPPLDGSAIINSDTKNFNLDLNQLQQVQTAVDNGNQPWRLDPVQTAQAEVPPTFNITATDNYVLVSVDKQNKKAVIDVTHDNIKYEINLIQPIRNGDSGIWATQSISKK